MVGVGRDGNFVRYDKIMKQMKGMRKGKPKWERAVSRRFYEAVCRQIREVSALSNDIGVQHLIKCLDEYIDRGSVKSDFTEVEDVVFTLLQPQIDKALERSRRARAAAARRREARMQSEALAEEKEIEELKVADEENPMPSVAENPSEAEAVTTLSREAKRARRREVAKERRIEKHRKRLARRGSKIGEIPDG